MLWQNTDQKQPREGRVYLAYGLQFPEGSQDKNSRQELEAETNGCMLLTGLLSYFSYTGKAHMTKEGTTEWAEPSSINYQSRNAQYAHKPIWGRRLFIWGSFFPGWPTWQQKLSKTIRLWGLCPNQHFNQIPVCFKQNLNKLLKGGRTVKRDLGVEVEYPPVPFPGCHEVMSLCHVHLLTWSLPKAMDSENAESLRQTKYCQLIWHSESFLQLSKTFQSVPIV